MDVGLFHFFLVVTFTNDVAVRHQFLCEYVFSGSLGCIPRGGIAGLDDNSIF